MAKTVTRSRGGRHGGSSADTVARVVSIAVCAVCALYVAYRLWPGGDGRASAQDPGRATPAATPGALPVAPDGAPNSATGAQLGGSASAKAAAKSGGDAAAPIRTGDGTAPVANNSKGGGADAKVERNAQDTAGEPAEKPVVYGAPKEREFFDNEVENLVASVSEPGAEFFGFPPSVDMSDEDVLALLKRPVEIYEDDDPEAIAAKERTAEFKSMAIEAMEKDGLTFNQFIRDLSHLRNEQAAMREDARSEMIRILKSRGEEEAREYLDGVNAELKAQGIKELEFPERFAKTIMSEKD